MHLELAEVRELIKPFDARSLAYPWKHPDPAMDELCRGLQELMQVEDRRRSNRRQIFRRIWSVVQDRPLPENFDLLPRAAIPYLNEPWYC
jgi:hypothetical protein